MQCQYYIGCRLAVQVRISARQDEEAGLSPCGFIAMRIYRQWRRNSPIGNNGDGRCVTVCVCVCAPSPLCGSRVCVWCCLPMDPSPLCGERELYSFEMWITFECLRSFAYVLPLYCLFVCVCVCVLLHPCVVKGYVCGAVYRWILLPCVVKGNCTVGPCK